MSAKNSAENSAYILVLIGAVLWGILGVFVHGLYVAGFSPVQVVAIRVTVGANLLALYLLITNRQLLKINYKDIHYFIGTGILSIAFFNWCYFTAIKEISLSIAAILLYTAPAFVLILARIIFKEPLSKNKLIALFLAIIGVAQVVGFFPFMQLFIPLDSLWLGLGSGLGYGLYSIFGKIASKKYNSLTVTTYTFILASLFMLPFSKIGISLELFYDFKTILLAVALGLFPTVLAYILYTKGLANLESGPASIVATVEPVIAVLVGVLFFNEELSLWQFMGFGFILAAIIIVRKKR